MMNITELKRRRETLETMSVGLIKGLPHSLQEQQNLNIGELREALIATMHAVERMTERCAACQSGSTTTGCG
jgi:hypothetical protein